ncbi:MAG: hypothetical protein L6U99_12025 [Clostridium sp.]|nr:MAG: hypothetical protein L6U99_12025 [Clostridium sp.]
MQIMPRMIFLKRMSHDLRTPITGIKGLLEIGDYYSDNIEKQNECRNKIKGFIKLFNRFN